MNHADSDRPAAPAPARRGRAQDFRPSLFGDQDEPAAAGTDGLRILGSLQPVPRPRRRRGWWLGGGAALLVLLLAALAWLPGRQAAGGASRSPADAVTVPPAPAASQAGEKLRETLSRATHDAAGEPPAGAARGAARIESAAARPADPFTVLAPMALAPRRPGIAPAGMAATRPSAASPAPQPASVAAQDGSADRDVALIEAMVAHNDGRGAVPPDRAARGRGPHRPAPLSGP